ncbi:MAG TPA: hypothetical protein DEP35_22265 [Deltaproteobacteria bacterium]|nr:hypothetical protein [Deltaproteobacteria bacterium]
MSVMPTRSPAELRRGHDDSPAIPLACARHQATRRLPFDPRGGCACTHGEEKRMTSRPVRIVLSALLVTSLGGCATSGRVDALEKRLDDVSRKADDAAAAAANAQKTANSAVSRAEAAEAQAKISAQKADEAARTSEAIFKKRVSK